MGMMTGKNGFMTKDENRSGLKVSLNRPPIVSTVDLGASKVACFIMKPEGVRKGDRTLTTCGVGYVQSRGIRGGSTDHLRDFHR